MFQPANVALTLQPLCADVKSSNRKHRNEKMNRSIQNFLYGALQVRGPTLCGRIAAFHLAASSRLCWGDCRSSPRSSLCICTSNTLDPETALHVACRTTMRARQSAHWRC